MVSEIIRAAGGVRGTDFAADLDWIARVRAHTEHALRGFDGLLLPVTVEHPTVEAVRADPVGVNRRLGTYTNFANLLDMAAMAVPLGVADGGPFGVMVLAPAFSDHVALDLASRLTGDHGGPPMTGESRALLVAGAADGLDDDLVGVGALAEGAARTADGHHGELWRVSPAGLGRLVGRLPAGLALGPVLLADGREVAGVRTVD